MTIITKPRLVTLVTVMGALAVHQLFIAERLNTLKVKAAAAAK